MDLELTFKVLSFKFFILPNVRGSNCLYLLVSKK